MSSNNNDDSKLEWHEISKKVVYKTRVFDVTERTSRSPDGKKEGVYIVNDAPSWAIVIPSDGDDFLMVKQWRHGEQSLSIEFPGGVIEEGEDICQGAKRELLEETGAVAGKITKLGSFNPNPALFSNHVNVFLAEDLMFTGNQNLDEDEFVNYIRVPKKEVIESMGRGLYFHALMASALMLYMAYNSTQLK